MRILRSAIVFFFFLGVVLAQDRNPSSTLGGDALRLFLNEVQPGTLSSEQYCLLVFHDRHFHAERAVRKMGKDRDRKAYEGELSEKEWSALGEILDSKKFRELYVPQVVSPLVIEDAHAYNISVARGNKFQNLEFLDNKSRKPYESQLKPLLQWWKSVRRGRMSEANVPGDSRCSPDSAHPLFAY